MMHKPKTRLYIDAPLTGGSAIAAGDDQANYLLNTLRCRGGELVGLFNGADGEWLAEVEITGKKRAAFRLREAIAPQAASPDIWLAFAPVKNEKIDYTVKRAVELGVSALLPVFTRHTIVSRVNMERLAANAVEAAEQSGRMDVPAIKEPAPLDKILSQWPHERTLFFCDESGAGAPVRKLLPTLAKSPCGVLIGPEGGFAPEERHIIARQPFARALSLGPRILRAETAALAALANVMAWLGDWDQPPHFEGTA